MSPGIALDIVSILEQLVAHETISDRSNLHIVDWIVERLAPAGVRVSRSFNADGSKANLLVSFGPRCAGGVVLSGHTDVVPVAGQAWSTNPFTVSRVGDRLHGRGTCDMKGFVAASMAAISEADLGKLKRPLHLALSYDEEVGHLGVAGLIRDLLATEERPAVAIIGEPTEMKVGLSHRGFAGHKTTFLGKAAHSGDPSLGVNAIHAAADFIQFLRNSPEIHEYQRDGLTYNVGAIKGGAAVNIVPSLCELEWEFRAVNVSQAECIRALIRAYLSPARDVYSIGHTDVLADAPPLSEAGPDAIELLARLGFNDCVRQLSFCTEAGHFQAAGIAAVVCGPGSIQQAHQADEWVALEQLFRAKEMVQRLIEAQSA